MKPTKDAPWIANTIRNGYVREGEEGEIVEPVTIYYPQHNNCPYFECPECGGGCITRSFQRCIDCGARIKWKKLETRTAEQMGVKNVGGGGQDG